MLCNAATISWQPQCKQQPKNDIGHSIKQALATSCISSIFRVLSNTKRSLMRAHIPRFTPEAKTRMTRRAHHFFSRQYKTCIRWRHISPQTECLFIEIEPSTTPLGWVVQLPPTQPLIDQYSSQLPVDTRTSSPFPSLRQLNEGGWAISPRVRHLYRSPRRGRGENENRLCPERSGLAVQMPPPSTPEGRGGGGSASVLPFRLGRRF